MAYEAKGSGVPLLLIHGYPLSREIWRPQLEGLAEIARVIAPDLRGFGESQAVQGIYAMDRLAQDCLELLDHLKITKPAMVCGHSMGGYVTFAFFRRYPERVRALVLTSTRAAPDSPEAKANREKAVATAREKGAGAIAEAMLPRLLSPRTQEGKPELVARVRQIMESSSVDGIAGALLGMRDRPDSGPTLSKIDKPTLILHGIDDPLIPLAEAQAMQAAIQGAQLHSLPKAGHLPSLEQPELFNRYVREFMARL
jgi:pimeloyl-ACP methyl ester carboxylesterase